MDLLTRFLNIQQKPFTTLDFIQVTGIPQSEAIRLLSKAENDGRIRNLNNAWIIRPVNIALKRCQYDFKPDEKKLKEILSIMEPGIQYTSRELALSYKLSHRTLIRYLSTLLYLGCIKTGNREVEGKVMNSNAPRYRKYEKINNDFEASKIPYYFSLAKSLRESEKQSKKRNKH